MGGEDEYKTVLEALDDALFDFVVSAILNRPLREYLETASMGRPSS